jgi:hypothetical protein
MFANLKKAVKSALIFLAFAVVVIQVFVRRAA